MEAIMSDESEQLYDVIELLLLFHRSVSSSLNYKEMEQIFRYILLLKVVNQKRIQC